MFLGTDATQLVSNQKPAASNLVASLDGTRLLYIGGDGYIYGFDIIDIWQYKYIVDSSTRQGGFMKQAMMSQSIVAIDNLIYPTIDRIYYIASYIFTGDTNDLRRVHGFINPSGNWHTISPTYAAVINHNQNLSDQLHAQDSLAYHDNDS